MVQGGADERVGDGRVEPVHAVHLAQHDEFVAVGADRSVVVEAVAQLRVAADHVGGLEHHARHRVVDAAARAGHLRAGGVHDLFLGVVHHHHARLHALAHHRAGGERAVGVEQLDPVVVLDLRALRVVLADPHAGPAAAQGEHEQVVGVGGVDAPLLVRRDEVERDLGVAVGLAALHLGRGLQVHRRAVAAEALAEGQHPRMVDVELLAAREGAPWDQLVHVGVAGVVADGFALDAAPGGRADDLARLRLHVAEADLLVLAVQRQVGMVAAGLPAERVPGLHGHVAVGLGRELQDHLAGVDVGVDARHAVRGAVVRHGAVQLTQLLHLGLRVPADALAAVAHLLHQGPERGEAAVEVGVVALHHAHLRAGLAGDEVAFAARPVGHAEGLGQFAGGVVRNGAQHQVAFHPQVAGRERAERAGESLVDVPVAARLPGRVHRGGERVDERVHVAGVEVVLLVPGGGGQHDVRIEARGAHAEVERDQQVQLAFGRLRVPFHLGRLGIAFAQVLTLHAVARAQQVFEEVFVPLARRAQDVGAPHEHVARPVVGVVRVGAAHLERPALQALHRVGLRVQARGLGVAHHLQRVGLQLRGRGQPAHALGAHVVVDHAAAELRAVGQGREHLFHAELLVAPLVGVRVEEAGGVLLARRAHPVESEGERRPAGLRPQLFLAHVVRPAAAALADAAAHHQHVDDAAVVHVAVVPVVHRRADDHHRAAARAVRVVGELARHRDHLRARRAGDLLLPCGGVGRVVVVAGGRVLAGQATRHAVLRHLQVEHGGDEHLARGAVGIHGGQAPHGHGARDHVGLHVRRKMLAFDAAEVRETDLRRLPAMCLVRTGLHQRQAQPHRLTRARVLVLQVPLALVGAAVRAPAEADRALRAHDLAVRIERHGLPLGMVVLAQPAREIAGAHVAVGHAHHAAVRQRLLAQRHQHGHVGVAAHVFVEIRAALALLGEVELLEDHVAHGHRHGGVGALLGVHPEVGELGDFGIVRRHRHRLRALVAHLGEEVGIGRARLRHVGAPGDDVAGVVPVGRFGHVGLLAPHLRAGGRQVAVPVVEAHAHAADQAQVARAGRVAHHRHRGNRRKADDAVRSVALDGVDVGGGDDLVHLVPAGAREAAQAAHALPALARGLVADDRGPGLHRPHRGPRRAPGLQQPPAHHGVLHAVGAVEVPAVARAAGAAARLVVGHVPAGARVVGLLGFPCDDAALDVDLPRAGARAVHAVGGAHGLVVRPAVAVGVFPGAVFTVDLAVAAGERFARLAEVREAVEKVAHRGSLESRHVIRRVDAAPASPGAGTPSRIRWPRSRPRQHTPWNRLCRATGVVPLPTRSVREGGSGAAAQGVGHQHGISASRRA